MWQSLVRNNNIRRHSDTIIGDTANSWRWWSSRQRRLRASVDSWTYARLRQRESLLYTGTYHRSLLDHRGQTLPGTAASESSNRTFTILSESRARASACARATPCCLYLHRADDVKNRTRSWWPLLQGAARRREEDEGPLNCPPRCLLVRTSPLLIFVFLYSSRCLSP